MTNQNNAAQAAKPQTVLSFDERERILCQFMGEPIHHDREMAIAIETAVLSKLRAPVADESVELPPLSAIDAEPSPHGSYEVYESEYVKEYARSAVLADRQKRAALASAPVADERAAEHVKTLRRMRADYKPSDGPMSSLKAAALDAALSALASALVAGESYTDENGTVWTRPTAWAYAQVCKARDKWQAAASAPVAGEAVAWMHEEDQNRVISAQQKAQAERDGGAYASSLRPYTVPLTRYAAPQPRPSDDALWDQTLTERDEYHDMADKLANAIADHLLIEIGEHSSRNCPWMRALEAIENAAPQASEAVRILFPTHLRKVWSGGEVQAWLDEHQGVTALKPSAKGSLERYREWQAERDDAFGSGIKAAADLVKKMVDAYDTDHGSTDPETGTREYPGEGATWVCEMQELEESIRALSAQPGAQKEQSDA